MRTGTETEIKLTLIRHGATPSNREHRYLGRTEEELDQEGIRELLLKKAQGRYPAVSTVFSGPMLRCRQTAERIFPGQELRLIPEWTEMDFGSFEGKNYRELNGNAAYQRWIDSGGTLPFPGGESREAFVERSMKGLWRLLEACTGTGEREAAAVVHGGTIMAVLSTLSGGNYFDYQVKNGEGYALRVLCRENKVEILEWKQL